MHNVVNISPISVFELPQSFLEHIPGFIALTDRHSKTLCSNSYTAKSFGYGSLDNMIGKSPFDMCCPAVQSAQLFYDQDRMVRETRKTITILDVHVYSDGNPKILFTKKHPYFENEALIGTVYLCTEIYMDSLVKLTSMLIDSDKKYYTQKQPDRSYQVLPVDHNATLSSREMECIFYLLRGQTYKAIARKLNLSPRTIEKRLDTIKTKLKCYTKGQLIEYCLTNGYINYVPSAFITKDMSGILHMSS